MWKKRISITLMLVCSLVLISSIAQAATITECTFDKDWYYPGQTGYIAVTVYNDENSTIRVDKLSATIDYYYTDDNVYRQTFSNYPDPPKEILQGESYTFNIDFSLPTNIAPGYTTLYVKAETEIWSQGHEWRESDHPTYSPTLYIESPYKDQLETQEAANQELETANEELETANRQVTEQLHEQQILNQQTTNMMYILGAVTVVLIVVVAVLLVILRKARSYALSLSAA
jgi:hypothetical protein